MENITELGKLWQEEIINLSDTQPENLDALEGVFILAGSTVRLPDTLAVIWSVVAVRQRIPVHQLRQRYALI